LDNLDGRTSSNTTEINKGIKFNVDGGERTYALGETIGVTTDDNIVTTATDDGVNVALADSINVGTANPVTIDGTAGTVSGLTNTEFDPTATYTGGQAATQEQLSAASGALTDLGFNIAADSGSEDDVDLGQTVTYTNDDGNLESSVRDNEIVYDLADDISVNQVTIGDDTNETILTSTADGLDVGGDNITNVGAGAINAGSTDAVNGSQLFDTAESVANNLGGNSVVNPDGTVSAPSYELDDGSNTGTNTTVNNVGDALDNLDGRTSSNTTEINKGFNISAEGGTADNVKLGETVDFTNDDNNLVVTNTDNTINYDLADDISVNQVTIGDDTNETILTSTADGLDVGGDNITNVGAGAINAGSTDAVNGSQLFDTAESVANNLGGNSVVNPDGTVSAPSYELDDGSNTGTNTTVNNVGDALDNLDGRTSSNTTEINKGFNIIGDNGVTDNVKLGDEVKFTSVDGNIITTSGLNDNEIDFALGNTITVGDATGGNPITVDGTAGTVSGLTNTEFDPTATYTGGQAATQEQLSAASGALTDLGFNIAADSGSEDDVDLGQTVTYTNDDGNLESSVRDNEIVYDLADDISVDSVTAGNTILNNAGITIVNGPNNTVLLDGNGLNNGGNRVTNVGAGVVDTDAANFGQLVDQGEGVANIIGGETTYNPADGTFTNNNIGGTGQSTIDDAIKQVGQAATEAKTTVSQGDNIVVTTTTNDDGSTDYEVTTANDLEVESVTTGNTVTNNDGVAVDDGEGNSTTVSTAGTTVADATGNSAEYTAEGMAATDSEGNSTIVNQSGVGFTDSDGNATGPSITAGGINANDTVISGVADGVLDSDAANVGQLNDIANTVNQGFNISAQGENSTSVTPGETVDFNSVNDNIKVSKTETGDDISFELNNNLDLGEDGSVTTGNTVTNNDGVTIDDGTGNVTNVTAEGTEVTNGTSTSNYGAEGFSANNGTNTTVVNQEGVSFTDNEGNVTGPSINANGIDAGSKTITGVADGIEISDAVNLGQLNALDDKLSNSVNDLGYKINEVEDEANAGISAAMAMSSLPQAYIPGKSMVGGGVATYNGESAVAVGVSKVSDNGRWIMKINGTADTQGNAGGAIGAGFHF
ncbi:MAG: YadA-like family protein, partial [Psychrobacter sp.]